MDLCKGQSTEDMLRRGSKEAHQPEICLQCDPEKEVIETVSKETVSCCLLPTVFKETAYNIYSFCINRTALNKYLSTVQGVTYKTSKISKLFVYLLTKFIAVS